MRVLLPSAVATALFIAVLTLLAWTTPAGAQGACARHDEIVATLGRVHSETLVWQGVESRGGLLAVYASPTGTWTALVVRPDGISCVVASGEGSETIPPGRGA